MEALLALNGITCRFPGGVVANDAIDFEVKPGEVHALLGENGAGKSTLMKVAFGMQSPTEGELLWRGHVHQFESAADAMAVGIGMVHQHFMLIPSFTVWENIILGHEPTQGVNIAAETAREQVRALSQRYGLKIDPNSLVSDISVGEQQRVEILKTLYREVQLLILDEPTAVLTPQETDELFVTLRQLVKAGLTIIFISHKLREVKAIADRVTILRKGKKVAEARIEEHDVEALAELMVGRPPAPPDRVQRDLSEQVVLQLKGLQVQDNRGMLAIRELSLDLYEGEILGIAGVEGNGQSELLEALIGLRPTCGGQIVLHGQEISPQDVRQRFQRGLAHVPADRQRQGLILAMSIQDNLLLGRHHESRFLRRGIWLDLAQLSADAAVQIAQFGIDPAKPSHPVSALSGGNQQKVVIAREFSRPATVFLIAHPTRGVDVGAIESIHAQLLQRRREGASILLISSELPELLALCDRIAVLYEGQLAGLLPAQDATEARLGVWMTGGE